VQPKSARRQDDPWRANEESRRRQLREDGRRPLAVNLAEGLALSEFLSTFPKERQAQLMEDPQRLRGLLKKAQDPGQSGD
jgi:hypothetical protein